jgi:hypothetical protein
MKEMKMKEKYDFIISNPFVKYTELTKLRIYDFIIGHELAISG